MALAQGIFYPWVFDANLISGLHNNNKNNNNNITSVPGLSQYGFQNPGIIIFAKRMNQDLFVENWSHFFFSFYWKVPNIWNASLRKLKLRFN